MHPRFTLAVLAAFGLSACANGPTSLLNEATGAVSQTLCSKVFLSGLDSGQVFDQHLRPEPGMGAIAGALHYEVDPETRSVRARVFGGFAREAVYREGRGCTLLYPDSPLPEALPPLAHAPALLPDIAPSGDVVVPSDPCLVAALDAAFAEPARGAPRNTQAIVVVHRGQIIAERYAAGFSPDTPLLSHSMTKSIVNALIGVLVREGRLDVDDLAPVPDWDAADDPRHAISVDNLLRMNAGFGFDEGGGASVATHIWYTMPDTASASAEATLRSPPGESWGYCSRCYALLSRVIGDTVGGGPESVRDFAQRELFDPLGMEVTLEFDAAGTMMGGQASLATPRDWARFGLLYLNDGMIGDHRMLPEGWVQYSTQPTGASGYGAGFWLNDTDAEIPEWRMRWGLPGAPADAYFARGYLGQFTVIVPSADLVIVRFGQSHARGGDVASVGQLVHDVIATLPDA